MLRRLKSVFQSEKKFSLNFKTERFRVCTKTGYKISHMLIFTLILGHDQKNTKNFLDVRLFYKILKLAHMKKKIEKSVVYKLSVSSVNLCSGHLVIFYGQNAVKTRFPAVPNQKLIFG